eukprot:492764_1
MKRLLTAALYTWSGICIGVSFMDAPMKFTTPSLKREVAFDVGRTLFGLLWKVETGLFVTISALLFLVLREKANAKKKTSYIKYLLIITALMAYQQFYLAPILLDRIQQIIDGKEPPPSQSHIYYVFSEFIKIITLWIFASKTAKRSNDDKP